MTTEDCTSYQRKHKRKSPAPRESRGQLELLPDLAALKRPKPSDKKNLYGQQADANDSATMRHTPNKEIRP